MRYHVPLDVALAQLLTEYLSAAYRLPGAATTPLGTFRMECWYKNRNKKIQKQMSKVKAPWWFFKVKMLEPLTFENLNRERHGQKVLSKKKNLNVSTLVYLIYKAIIK